MATATIDLTTLNDLTEHPAIREQHRLVDQAQQQADAANRTLTNARTELTQAEDAAAMGKRDEKRLTRAQEALAKLESEQRIAQRRLEQAQTAVQQMLPDLCRTVEQELTAAHREALRDLADALKVAHEKHRRVATIETASQRLFAGGMYRRLPGHPLQELAWTREFGGPTSTDLSDTRFAYWLGVVQRYLGLKAGA